MLALGKLLELTLAGREPAQKIQLTVDGVQMRWLSEGALEVRPPQARDNGSDLLLSSGIHGNETAPIELLDRLLHGIARGEIKPRARILFLFGNPEAMRRGERYLELDINRLFNGRHEKNIGPEAMRAAELEQLARSFFSLPAVRACITTCTRPFAARRSSSLRCTRGRKAASTHVVNWRACTPPACKRCCCRTRRRSPSPRLPTNSWRLRPSPWNWARRGRSAQRGGGCFTPGAAPQADHRRHRAETDSLDGMQLFAVAREVIKHSDAFLLHLPADVENFSELEKGYLLAEDVAKTRWVIEEEGARIIFPNPKVKNGLRAGILIVPTTDAGLA